MELLGLLTTVLPTLVGIAGAIFGIAERRRAKRAARLEIDNDRLRIQNQRLKEAMEIEDDIDALSDDDLRERMRDKQNRHRGV